MNIPITSTDSSMRAALGFVITVGFFGVVFVVLFYPVPATVRDIVLVLLGALITSFKEVTGYFYGGSSGSAGKDKTIAMQAATAATTAGIAPQVDSADTPLVKIDDSTPIAVKETKA